MEEKQRVNTKIGEKNSYIYKRGNILRSISIEELREEVESYIEAAKSSKGDSAYRYLNKAKTALISYEDVPDRFIKTYMALIEDLQNDLR